MIVDCHTHVWSSLDQLGRYVEMAGDRAAERQDLAANPAGHALAAECVHRTLVLGVRSAWLGANVPNDFIADYVARQGGRMIGIAAIDPTESGAVAAAEELLARPEFRGLTVSPATQNCHPADSRAMALYALAEQRGAPVVFHNGPQLPAQARMEYARPVLLDEIAREFPKLTMVVSSLGMPWVDEGISLLSAHPRVFGDISGLLRRPWRMYNAMVLAYEAGAMDKVFFASDFPHFTAADAIKALYRINEVTQGTNLPTVPREKLRAIVECDALGALAIAGEGEGGSPAESDADEDVAQQE